MPPQLQPSSSELFSACQVLFGRKACFSPVFLSTLHPDSLKSTFREKALSTHPDRAAALGKDPAHLEREFCKVKAAYEVLTDHLKSRPAREAAPPRPARRPRSGKPSGAKGGKAGSPPGAKGAPPAGKTSPGRTVSRFWSGQLPQKSLKFGQFLFFSGAIPARDLIDALFWQRRQRPPFGQIAREWGILTAEQVGHVLRRKLPAETFGECAARLGYMTSFEKHAVACKQKNLQRPFGEYFVESGILDRMALEQALRMHRSHNQRFMR